MPNMKDVCRTLDKMQKSIADLFARVDQLAKVSAIGSFFSGTGAPPPPVSSDGSAGPGAVSAAAPVPPPPPAGPRAFMDESVFEGHDKNASQRKMKEFSEDYDKETEADTVRRLVDEVFEEKYQYDIDYIGISPASGPSKYSGAAFAQMLNQMVSQAVGQAMNQAAGKPGGGGGAPMPAGGAAGTPGGGGGAAGGPGGVTPAGAPNPAGVPPNVVNFVNTTVSRSALNLLTNVFGRRIASMLTPDNVHASDWLYMAQNVKWIDGKVASGINKAIADKVASGLMTQAEGNAAKGFMSSEGLGGQIAGGALIGIFIFQNIPKIAAMLRDNIDFITGISDALFDTKTGKLMSYLDRIVADLNSITGAWKPTMDFVDAIGVLDLDAGFEESKDFYDRMRGAISSQEAMKAAGERWVRRKGSKVRAEIAKDQFSYFLDSIWKSLGFK